MIRSYWQSQLLWSAAFGYVPVVVAIALLSLATAVPIWAGLLIGLPWPVWLVGRWLGTSLRAKGSMLVSRLAFRAERIDPGAVAEVQVVRRPAPRLLAFMARRSDGELLVVAAKLDDGVVVCLWPTACPAHSSYRDVEEDSKTLRDAVVELMQAHTGDSGI